MRIGEFSRKNNITQDTIRHYIDLGLLVVEKQGSHYHFTEENSSDLRKILMLKELDFTLAEIQTILCFNRLEGEHSRDYRSFLRTLLEQKRERVKQKLQIFDRIDRGLKQSIQDLSVNNSRCTKSWGFPLSSISLLRCPQCGKQLQIVGGSIENHMLLYGTVFCECGYKAGIEDGIYIDLQAVGKKTHPTKEEFLAASSPQYINFLYSATTALIEYILCHPGKPEYILELDNCAGRFLMQYIEHMPEDCTYIVIGTDMEKLVELKDHLQSDYPERRFMFLFCDPDRIPLASGSIDIIVNHGMSTRYILSRNKFLPSVASPLLKKGGLFTGVFLSLGAVHHHFADRSPETSEYFYRKRIVKGMEDLHYCHQRVEEIGPLIENNPYLKFRDREQYQVLYAGIKEEDREALTGGIASDKCSSWHKIS